MAQCRLVRVVEGNTYQAVYLNEMQVTWRNADWCEGVLRWWSDNWSFVCEEVGAEWRGEPYVPADFENALCIYQERR